LVLILAKHERDILNKIKSMGLRNIPNLEKPVDVRLNETKKSSCLGSHESYHASKIKNIKKHSKALLVCF
jgi:hypothetical protein